VHEAKQAGHSQHTDGSLGRHVVVRHEAGEAHITDLGDAVLRQQNCTPDRSTKQLQAQA
jgi:hypothetical protein